MDQSSKRIAKNTLFLYFRMLLLLVINLYVGRLVLQTLGVSDYGVYNVVGGVIAMLGFLTGSLSGASSRYITFGLGKGDINKLKTTFGNILTIHYILAGVVLLFGETVGLWFLETQLQIPQDRENAAFWVYQFSVITSILAVISVPYNAVIIAHEKMSAFAFISLLDGVLKLLVAFLLIIASCDKLILYAGLLLVIQLLDRVIYYVYCRKHFEESHAPCGFDKLQFKEIFAYAGWTMNGSLADMGYTQGLNILLNIFYGPVVNAARGVAVQVQGVCQQFCSNFQMALNPQITKSYAQNDFDYMHKLLIRSSKFSYFIMLLIALPLMFEGGYVLQLWLETVPDNTVPFFRLTMVIGMLFTLRNPIIVSVHATGNLKRFQIIEGTMLLSIVPIAYVLVKFFHISPWYVFAVHIVVEMFTQLARLYIVLPMISMRIRDYMSQVLRPVIMVTLAAPIVPICFWNILNQNDFKSFVLMSLLCIVWACVVVLFMGCSKNERKFILDKIIVIKTKMLK